MSDMAQALQDFGKSGYKIDITFASRDDFPLEIKVEEAEGKIMLRDENRLICTVTATKTGGKGQVVVHLADEQIDLIE